MLLFVKLVLGSLYLFCVARETKCHGTTRDNNTAPVPQGHRQNRDGINVCDFNDIPYDINGYPLTGKGIELSVNFLRINNTWKSNVSWDHPTSEQGRSKCIGYIVTWYKETILGGPYCKIILNENITHYVVDYTTEMEKYGQLGVAVFPLPRKSKNANFMMRWFTIPTLTTTPTRKTTLWHSITTKTTAANFPMTKRSEKQNPKNSSTKDVTNSGAAKRSSISTLVVAIVIEAAWSGNFYRFFFHFLDISKK